MSSLAFARPLGPVTGKHFFCWSAPQKKVFSVPPSAGYMKTIKMLRGDAKVSPLLILKKISNGRRKRQDPETSKMHEKEVVGVEVKL